MKAQQGNRKMKHILTAFILIFIGGYANATETITVPELFEVIKNVTLSLVW
ncbi:hypothetical protein [Pseudoalteromonas marina]|uniref:Uncharacterized protein n=1 Tax=Pseudoalteromonas marina TaxID=267375 RepID=A0ABT9FI67_9GAMM|nr:hypothetical protein [Pseudoalteromonas marina]MDP2566454.1 hypothetical protein [Pseudoalteromonas marina]